MTNDIEYENSNIWKSDSYIVLKKKDMNVK